MHDLIGLEADANAIDVALSEDQLAAFRKYADLLESANKELNLTAVDASRFGEDHFIDSLTLLQAGKIREGDMVADVGSGAGLPGVAIKIARPSVRLTLIEANRKKAAFLLKLIGALGLKDAKVFCGRAEEAGHNPELREAFDAVIARGVARLPVLLEYALPLAKPDGWVLAMKGPKAVREISEASGALDVLGGRILEVFNPTGVAPALGKVIIVIEKTTPTTVQYPRKIGMPAKRPLKEDSH